MLFIIRLFKTKNEEEDGREKTVHLTNNTIHYGKYVYIVF